MVILISFDSYHRKTRTHTADLLHHTDQYKAISKSVSNWPHCMHRMMPPKATHVARSVVCLSVCLSVCLYVWHKGEPCRTSEPIEMRFGGRFAWAQATVHYTESGPRGVYIGATWRIRLNDPCAVETRPSGFFS